MTMKKFLCQAVALICLSFLNFSCDIKSELTEISQSMPISDSRSSIASSPDLMWKIGDLKPGTNGCSIAVISADAMGFDIGWKLATFAPDSRIKLFSGICYAAYFSVSESEDKKEEPKKDDDDGDDFRSSIYRDPFRINYHLP